MARTFKLWWDFGVIDAGRPELVPYVSREQPVKEVTFSGDNWRLYDVVLLPKWEGGSQRPVVLWDWTRGDTFQFLAFQLKDGEGYAHLAWKIDKPVSSTDFTPESEDASPTTTWRRTCHADLSCHTPFFLNAVQSLVHPTLATGAGFDSNGDPAILTDGSTVAGRIARIWGKNNSTTVDRELLVWVRN